MTKQGFLSACLLADVAGLLLAGSSQAESFPGRTNYRPPSSPPNRMPGWDKNRVPSYPSNRMPGWDNYWINPYSPYNYGRNPYNPVWVYPYYYYSYYYPFYPSGNWPDPGRYYGSNNLAIPNRVR